MRMATEADVPALVAMGERFIAESEYRAHIGANAAQMSRVLTGLVTSADGCVLVTGPTGAPTGMIGLVLLNHPYSDERIASELFWWVEPERRGDGLRLLRAAEDWARSHGATRMQMVAPNDRVSRLYERLGYSRVEVAYQRSL